MSLSPAFPPLREELSLHKGGRLESGEPSWVLQDPVVNRFFRIGWFEFEVLTRWQMGTAEVIAVDIERSTTLQADAERVDQVLRFLSTHNLLQVRGPQALKRLMEQHQATRKGGLMWLLKNYLFVRVPLLRPDRFLERTYPLVSVLYSARALWLLLALAVTGLFLVVRQWDAFLATFPHLFTLQGALVVGCALALAKVLHEFGHAYTARRYGCGVPSMGVAFLVLWPVLYTDATDAWRLTSRRQRLAIASAGIVVELGLAVLATFFWSFMEDGPARTAVFMLATTTWIVTLIINLNPFMRFDGYYLMSDWMGMPNLQDRAFALGRWRLREWLFGFDEPAPEYVPDGRRRLLIAYAWGTWIYRFFLFLGIALLVYHLFFKALGILLMLVELAWFIGKPVWNEVKQWRERREAMQWNSSTLRTTCLVFLLLGMGLFPWQGRISAPALYQAAEHAVIHVPQSAQVTRVVTQHGQTVRAGDLLVSLASPDLDHEIAQVERRIDALRWQLEFGGVSTLLRERSQVMYRELEGELAHQAALLDERQRLEVIAPLAGRVSDLQRPLTAGQWVREGEWLATVVAPQAGYIEAYVRERDLAGLQLGTSARFYPDDISRRPLNALVADIDQTSTRRLAHAFMASVHDGAIAARVGPEGEMVPEEPLYRVLLESVEGELAPGRTIVGTVRIDGERRSWMLQKARQAYAVIIRESGF